MYVCVCNHTPLINTPLSLSPECCNHVTCIGMDPELSRGAGADPGFLKGGANLCVS